MAESDVQVIAAAARSGGHAHESALYSILPHPVLSLSQISDFLTAGILHPAALLLVLSTFPIIWALDRLNARARRRYRRAAEELRERRELSWWQRLRLRRLDWHLGAGNRIWMQVFYFSAIVLYGWNFVSIYAGHEADAAATERPRR
ncbi:MAG: hypothetical protein QM741_13635 [Rudaea sp.]|uniref:hypothetical protein n=1 Tax=Rudaea sp. TaxID=2136325 RepID=UPI0039E2A66D